VDFLLSFRRGSSKLFPMKADLDADATIRPTLWAADTRAQGWDRRKNVVQPFASAPARASRWNCSETIPAPQGG
jgi:hypothetical protein